MVAPAPPNAVLGPPPAPGRAGLLRDEPFTTIVDHRPTAAPAPPPTAPEAAPAPRTRVVESPSGPGGPRAPRREVEVLIEGYPGFAAWVWANYPQRLRDDLTSADGERIRAALLRLVVEHNGWCDEEGTPYPPASDPAFWDAIPTELSLLLGRAIREAPSVYPNFLASTGGR